MKARTLQQAALDYVQVHGQRGKTYSIDSESCQAFIAGYRVALEEVITKIETDDRVNGWIQRCYAEELRALATKEKE